jgi:hypothetical protein
LGYGVDTVSGLKYRFLDGPVGRASKVTAVEPTDIRTRLRDGAEIEANATAAPRPVVSQVLAPRGFLTGRDDDTLRDLLAYGQYARAAQEGREPMRIEGEPATADMIERYRAQANADLHAFAFRYMHNQAETIRQDAVREQLGSMRPPPGIAKLVLANLIGLGVAVLAWIALAGPGGVTGAVDRASAMLRSLGG